MAMLDTGLGQSDPIMQQSKALQELTEEILRLRKTVDEKEALIERLKKQIQEAHNTCFSEAKSPSPIRI